MGMRAILFALFAVFYAAPAFAACVAPGCTLTEIQQLNFGKIAITDHSAIRTVVIAPDGTATGSVTYPAGGITALDATWQQASFDLVGAAPNTMLSITPGIMDTTLAGTNGDTFDVKDFTFFPDCSILNPVCQTDGSGNLTINVGATLATRAGRSYANVAYHGTFSLIVNW
jgi:hypothetical protein